MSILFILLVIVGLAVVLALWGVGIYNGLVTARNAFKNAFAQIDVQLQRRFDLIPNLVETAKAYMGHERETLEAVVAARAAAQSGLAAAKANPGDPHAMAQLAAAQGLLAGFVVQAHPDGAGHGVAVAVSQLDVGAGGKGGQCAHRQKTQHQKQGRSVLFEISAFHVFHLL